MKQQLVIEGELPSENEIIAAQVPKFRVGTHWVSKYSEWKAARTREIVLAVQVQGLKPVKSYPIRLAFTFYTKDKRKNPDNILAGAMKFILDGLQEGGIIRNDGWSELVGKEGIFGERHHFWCSSDERPRIEIIIRED